MQRVRENTEYRRGQQLGAEIDKIQAFMSPPLRQEELTTPMAVELSKSKEKRLDDAWNSLEIQKQAKKYAHPSGTSFTVLQLDTGHSAETATQQ